MDTELVTLLDAAEPEAVANGADAMIEESRPNGDVDSQPFGVLGRYLKTPTWPLFKMIVEKALVNIPNTSTSAGD